MSEMIFQNSINLETHRINPDIWETNDGYLIMRFRYLDGKPCEPYFRAYSRPYNYRLGGDYSTFEEAAGMCMTHHAAGMSMTHREPVDSFEEAAGLCVDHWRSL